MPKPAPDQAALDILIFEEQDKGEPKRSAQRKAASLNPTDDELEFLKALRKLTGGMDDDRADRSDSP